MRKFDIFGKYLGGFGVVETWHPPITPPARPRSLVNYKSIMQFVLLKFLGWKLSTAKKKSYQEINWCRLLPELYVYD